MIIVLIQEWKNDNLFLFVYLNKVFCPFTMSLWDPRADLWICFETTEHRGKNK